MTQTVFELREPSLRDSSLRETLGAPERIEERTIGRILIDLGKLRERDVDRVLALHRKKGIRFGEAACRLGLVSDEDVYRALSVQFNYPYVPRGQGSLGGELLVAHSPDHAHSEAVREVRTQLLTQWVSNERKVLAIASTDMGDGRSYFAANLAVSFAQLGEKTLLIDADLRAPRLHRMFGIAGGHGLAQALTRRMGLEVAERIAYFDNLAVIAAGARPPNPLELLSRGELLRILDEARREYGIVIVDTPASVRGADARVIAARADGVLVLARKGKTRLPELAKLRDTVASSGVPVVGVVLNGA